MNPTATTILILTLTGIGWAWLWSESEIFEPLRTLRDKALTKPNDQLTGNSFLDSVRPERIPRDGPVSYWLNRKFDCGICTGFDAQLAGWFLLGGGIEWAAIPTVLAAVAGHVVYNDLYNTLRPEDEID